MELSTLKQITPRPPKIKSKVFTNLEALKFVGFFPLSSMLLDFFIYLDKNHSLLGFC